MANAPLQEGQLAGDGPLAAAGYGARARRNLGRVDEDRIGAGGAIGVASARAQLSRAGLASVA